MGFSIESSVPAITVFIQGLLSFLSPCILPLVPLYITYLSGGTKEIRADGSIHYPRKKILLNTLFFVIGISTTFFLLGFGFTALGTFFDNNRMWFARISGIVMILFGLYQFGFFGQSNLLEREHRLPFRLDRFTMGPLPAFLLGFTFSFAWTPCVGPTLGSVLLMAGSSGSSVTAFLLIGIYTLGFVLPFLAVGIFTGAVLDFFGRHKNIVKYTVKIGAILLILMGVMTLTGFMNHITSYLSNTGNVTKEDTSASDEKEEADDVKGSDKKADDADTELTPAFDFDLKDQFGNSHKLSDYKGKTVFLNFWATWCPPCRGEMPEIQKLYEKHGKNSGDVIVLGVAGPNQGNEGSEKEITGFLEDNGYSFPVVMDASGDVFAKYQIRAFPTTFMIDKDGNIFGYVESAMTGDTMDSIVEQTMKGNK